MRPPVDGHWTWHHLHLFTSYVRPLFCTLTCEGRDKVPRTGGCVLTCNHTMGPDFIVVSYASPRPIEFMAKAELFEVHPGLTWLLEQNGIFPIRRGEMDLTAVQHAVDLVQEGRILGMFPEGTRSRTGKLGKARSGAARIAIQAQAPVVPAVVINSEPIFQPGNWFSVKPRVHVTVRFGDPIPPPTDKNDSRALRRYIREIMGAMEAMLPQDRLDDNGNSVGEASKDAT